MSLNRYGQALPFAVAILAAIAVIAGGCVNKVKQAPVETAGAVVADGGCGEAADILFGAIDSAGALSLTFTDSRDCKKYRAVKIGKDIWMAQNLNYETDGSWCSENADANCAKFGRLYDWNAAQEACPAEWHLSTAEEWDNLMTAAGGKRGDKYESNLWTGASKKLRAKSGWNLSEGDNGSGAGTDDYGFSALPGGTRYGNNKFMEPGEMGIWWTSKENDNGSAYGREMVEKFSAVGPVSKEAGASVRCVSDDGVIVKAGERGPFSLTLKTGDGGTLSADPRKDSYAAGEKVTLSASPEKGYVFAGWTGGRAADSAYSVTTITVVSDTTVAVNFRRIDYGSLTDERDGKTYRTAKIGRGTWMAENLNYKPAEGGSSCREGKAGNCEKYGRLYNWNTAQKVCPAGWYLPAIDDWYALAVYAGGQDIAGGKLKAAKGWIDGYSGKNIDEYGFSALPGGSEGEWLDEGDIILGFGAWWTETTVSGGAASLRITWYQDKLTGLAAQKSNMYSVRCVMDEGWALTLTAEGGGTVSSVPSKTLFKTGETAAITALPKSGYVFSRWTGGKVADSTAAVTTVVAARSDMEITAHFRAAPGGASGTLADTRDGQKYRTTQIGEQVWMAQNLNYKTGNSRCYNDSASYCRKYGRLYDWNTAKTACPPGWHLPSLAEWEILATAAGGRIKAFYKEDDDGACRNVGKALKAKAGWNRIIGRDRECNGTDEYGFAALPGGGNYYDYSVDYDDNLFYDVKYSGFWWTATDKADDKDKAYTMNIYNYADKLAYADYAQKHRFSVRCVMGGRE
jgi:uncharacterized protein (TIGR02145 family)/uncharacterized repeat protein (TIGR02543 family)